MDRKRKQNKSVSNEIMIDKLKLELQELKIKKYQHETIENLKQEIKQTRADIDPFNRFIKKLKGVIYGNK